MGVLECVYADRSEVLRRRPRTVTTTTSIQDLRSTPTAKNASRQATSASFSSRGDRDGRFGELELSPESDEARACPLSPFAVPASFRGGVMSSGIQVRVE